MPEGLATADGETIDIDRVEQEFAAAMAAPAGDEAEAASPPDIGLVDPEAPFGRKADGTPKKGPGGRPPKDRPRVTDKAPKALSGPQKGGKTGGTAPSAVDYAKGLEEFLAGLALGLAVIPVPNDAVRVRCRYQSAVIEQTGDGLAKGVGMVAEHNGVARWAVEKLTQGGGAWVFPAAMAIAPFAVSSAMLWRSPVTAEMAQGAEQIQGQAMAKLRAEMGLDDLEQEREFYETAAGEPAAA